MKLPRNLLKILFLTTALCSCTNSLITLPEQTCPKPIKQAIIKPVQCPSMAMPKPIPENATIIISGGDIIKIDEGGEQLIREYASLRKVIKKLWHDPH